eukprot:GILJ01001004.1.p1 GENE.GILJ01001004.1~~GILJ01001004.1.p1  ORF type:complete len:475 (-),score=88.22 GILJ01001004.1:191-1615(-)
MAHPGRLTMTRKVVATVTPANWFPLLEFVSPLHPQLPEEEEEEEPKGKRRGKGAKQSKTNNKSTAATAKGKGKAKAKSPSNGKATDQLNGPSNGKGKVRPVVESSEEEYEEDSDDQRRMKRKRTDNSKDTAQEYFLSQRVATAKTSDRTLSQLKLLSQKQMEEEMTKLPPKHGAERATLLHYYESQYTKWKFQLLSGFNLLFFGYGSKKILLQNFASSVLEDAPLVMVNGYFPGLVIKQVLNTITEDLIGYKSHFRSTTDQVEFIRKALAGTILLDALPPPRIYILIHNIDGPSLRNENAQNVLSSLASMREVQMIASIDNLQAPLLWDHRTTQRFNWLWQDVTNFTSYSFETAYEDTILNVKGEKNARGVGFVLKSLTPNHRSILKLLAQHMLDNPASQGLDFYDYLGKAREEMVVSTEGSMKMHLTELKDHQVVSTRRGANGKEYLYIPYPPSMLQKIIDDKLTIEADEADS